MSTRTPSLLLVVAFLAAALLPTTSAETSVGSIYLTAQNIGTTPNTNCAEAQPRYAMTTATPSSATGAKAYLAEATIALSCTTFFDYTITEATTLSGTATVSLWLGCDQTTITRNAPSTFYSRQVTLKRGSASIGTLGTFGGDPTCAPATLIPWRSDVPLTDTAFAPGDHLVLELLIWALNPSPALDILYISTGSTAAPSSITAMGLGPNAPALEEFALSAEPSSFEVAPGGTASYVLNLTNAGSAFADFNLSASGLPEGADAVFETPSGRADAGSSHNVTLEVAVETNVLPGTYPFVVSVAGPNGGNASANLALVVSEGGASPPTTDPTAEPTDATDGTTPSDPNATGPAGNETGGAQSGAGGGVPGPGPVAFLVTALAALVLLGRRRGNAHTYFRRL